MKINLNSSVRDLLEAIKAADEIRNHTASCMENQEAVRQALGCSVHMSEQQYAMKFLVQMMVGIEYCEFYEAIDDLLSVKKSKEEFLRPVLEWLENGAVHKDEKGNQLTFDMDTFTEEIEGCGSTACMAGACAFFNDDVDVKLNVDRPATHIEACYEVGKAIGMPETDVDNLFFASNRKDEVDGITIKEAAKTLRGYIETGKVLWSENRE